MKHVDVAIIGAGTAGLSARREVEKVTDNYVVIDDGIMGTTCARVGCMPSKVLIQVANDYHRRLSLSEEGILGAEHISVDSQQAMNHVRKLRDRFVRSVYKGMESWQNTHLIRKRATFIDKNTLQLTTPEGDEEQIHAKSIIIATGSSPIIPKPWLDYKNYLIDTDTFFEMETLPQKVAVIGLGVIGIELGQALNRLGVEVIGLTLNKAIGGLSDPKIQDYAASTFEKEFTISYEGADLVGTRDGKLIVKSGEQEHLVDRALVTVGRRPNLNNLDLENLNLEMDARGLPLFDSSTFAIPNSSIFITGDVNGERPLLHEAADEGRIAGYNALRENRQCFRRRTSLGITFSDPNIATVGDTHQKLVDNSVDFATGSVSFEGFGRAIVKLKEKGLLHIYGDRKTGRLLGAEMMAPEGEHLAHLLAWALSLGLTAREALALPFYHPVMEEGLRTALRDLASQTEEKVTDLEVLRCQDPPVGRCENM